MTYPIYVVDDDADVRDSLRVLLESNGYRVVDYPSARLFLDAYDSSTTGCLVTDIRMPDMDGLSLQRHLLEQGHILPVIIMTGHGDVPLAVRAMKAGAIDFIEKPFEEETLIFGIQRALELSRQTTEKQRVNEAAAFLLASLTGREREVLDLLVLGKANKVIANDLGISPRTVEIHRGHVMEKLKAKSLSDLVRISLAHVPG